MTKIQTITNDIFELLLDLIFPKVDLSELGEKTQFIDLTHFYKSINQNNYLDEVLVIYDYQEVKKYIHLFKFSYQKYLGQSLVDKFSLLSSRKNNFKLPDLVAFVPADPQRLRIRGYHPPEILAVQISQKLELGYIDLFSKPYTTRAQTNLNREQRKLNLVDKFRVNSDIQIHHKIMNSRSVWIVDDVITTGSTLDELAKVLKSKYPFIDVTGVALTSHQD